jgi:hypothetical protein
MALPIRTIFEDVQAVCSYLATKPTGATLTDAKAVLDSKHLDGRKLSALKFWHLIEDQDDRLKITETGRNLLKQSGANRVPVLRGVIASIAPYRAIIERAAHRNEDSLSATEVGAHWHDHFTTEVSSNDKILNDQAVRFFHLAAAAELGNIVVGRKGAPTRFAFDANCSVSVRSIRRRYFRRTIVRRTTANQGWGTRGTCAASDSYIASCTFFSCAWPRHFRSPRQK